MPLSLAGSSTKPRPDLCNKEATQLERVGQGNAIDNLKKRDILLIVLEVFRNNASPRGTPNFFKKMLKNHGWNDG